MILSGIRVLTFTTGIAGPNAGRILASLGAEVIKVESRFGGIDSFRYFGSSDDINSSPRFAEANFGVRSLAVNLKRPEGLDLVKRLVRECDVVLENYRPDVLDRLGLGFAELRRLRPDIIQVKMPGLGSTGPMKDYGTWGALLNAYVGLTYLWNHPASKTPVGNQGVFPDYLTAALAPMVVVSALIRRERTGEGCLIDLAQSEATAYCALPVAMLDVAMTGHDPAPVGNRGRDGALQDVYPCAGDDAWCAIRAEGVAERSALLRAIGRPDLESADRAAVDTAVSEWTSFRTAGDVMRTLQAAGVAAGQVSSGLDLIADPQLARRGFIRRIEQPGIGEMVVPGLPLTVDPPVLDEPGPAPALGQDNEHIVRTILGLSDAEHRALIEKEVLA